MFLRESLERHHAASCNRGGRCVIGDFTAKRARLARDLPGFSGFRHSRLEIRFRAFAPFAAVIALVMALLPSSGTSAEREAIRFDLEVLPAFKRYVELAAYPPYVAVALQNNGFSPVSSGRIFIEDDRTVRVHVAVVSFAREQRLVYDYNVAVEWSLGVAQTKFEIPVEVDASRIGEGKLMIRVFPPLAGLSPDELNERIRGKLQSLANVAVQQRMLDYFDRLPGSGKDRLELDKMFHRVLIDAYNLPVVAPGLAGAREPGDALPLTDQWMFYATLVIWFLVVPTFLLIRVGLKRRKLKKLVA